MLMCWAGPPDRLKQWSKHGPLALLCQARPITFWVVSCLDWAIICVPRAGHDSRARGHQRTGILSRFVGLDVGWLEWFWCRSYGLV
jgi:hypothetical protein